MAEPTVSATHRPRVASRAPSGPRPPPAAQGRSSGSRATSSSSISTLLSGASELRLYKQPSLATLAKSTQTSLDALIDAEHNFTASPEDSPQLSAETPPRPESPAAAESPKPYAQPGAVHHERSRTGSGKTAAVGSPTARSNTSPFPIFRPSTPTSPTSRPTTPAAASPSSAKPKPKPSRLNTVNLLSPAPLSPSKPVSPGLKHWQQVRHHVLTTPVGSPSPPPLAKPVKKLNLVNKAAGKFGFRHAAEHVMGFDDERRVSVQTTSTYDGGLSNQDKEEIARERRMFARDIRSCLEACSLEESRRRFARLGQGRSPEPSATQPKVIASSVHASQHHALRYDFNPQFSSFVPLLTELHRHLPAARAKKPWSRTCPHHAAILAELSISFLPDSASTDGERQQALEIFGVLVKNWASETANEELDRWIWLSKALKVEDRQLRSRGFTLFASFLGRDPNFLQGHDRPRSVYAFVALAESLIELLHAVEKSVYAADHLPRLNSFFADLGEGEVLPVDMSTLHDLLDFDELPGSHGVEKELLWLAAVTAVGSSDSEADWLLDPARPTLQVRTAWPHPVRQR